MARRNLFRISDLDAETGRHTQKISPVFDQAALHGSRGRFLRCHPRGLSLLRIIWNLRFVQFPKREILCYLTLSFLLKPGRLCLAWVGGNPTPLFLALLLLQ
jgi:hypothetical protein